MKGRKESSSLAELRGQGQSIWLDYISRGLVFDDGFRRIVREEGITGITSNPSIFEKAINGSADYDDGLRALLAHQSRAEPHALYDTLAIADVRMAADILRPTYEDSGGADGFVSLEPPPQLTKDTASTIMEARRLWQVVNRPNLMIKVVATGEGIPAIEQLIGEGINVNITLMFSQRHYEAVAQAYLRGIERCRQPAKVASVASFFVSRIDTAVGRALEVNSSKEALALRGKIAIANAKVTYKRFREIFHGEAFDSLRRRGAHVQRVLWASTSTKDPAYPDVLYVEELIGPDTINTVTLNTLEAFRRHGKVRGSTVAEGLDEAEDQLRHLAALGIDLDVIAEDLQREGVAAFAVAYENVLAALDRKRQAIRGSGVTSVISL